MRDTFACKTVLTSQTLIFVLILILIIDASPLPGGVNWSVPGQRAATAYKLMESEDRAEVIEGCQLFITEIQRRSKDPWSWMGAAICADIFDQMQGSVESIFSKSQDELALGHFGQAYLSLLKKELETAENLFRLVLKDMPELALAWNALGAVVIEQSRPEEAIPLIEMAIKLAPGLGMARNNLDTAQLQAGVFSRLKKLLAEIPERWNTLPDPKIPISGRLPSRIIIEATETELEEATDFITVLSTIPNDKRASWINFWTERKKIEEVYSWAPALLFQEERWGNLREAALSLEAWLQSSESFGRKDSLIVAAGLAIELIAATGDILEAKALAGTYSNLNLPTEVAYTKAFLYLALESIFFKLGHNVESLQASQDAKRLFEDAGDTIGLGNSWLREGEVLDFLGRYGESISCFRKAREIFLSIDNVFARDTGLANAWVGEANVLVDLSDYARALSAFRNARELYQNIDQPMCYGRTWLGEAGVFHLQGKIGQALSSLGHAQEIDDSVDFKIGTGAILLREADVLVQIGKTEEALRKYREARKFYEFFGDLTGQGLSWEGEARVLLRARRTAEALAASVKAVALAESQDSPVNEINAILVEASVRRNLNEWERVVGLAVKAIKIFDNFRREFFTDYQRTNREGEIRSAYDLSIGALWRLSRPFEALEYMEQARSRVLLDLVATHHAIRASNAENEHELKKQRENLVSNLAGVEKKLAIAASASERRKLLLQQELLDDENERLLFESLLSTESPLANGQPLDRMDILRTPKSVGSILFYYIGSNESYVFLLRDNMEPVAKAVEISKDELFRQGRQLAETLANPNYQQYIGEPMQSLWDTLLAPVADHLPSGGSLTLILHGPLHQIPFEALTNPSGEPLFERYDVTVAPSISTLHHIRTHHRPSQSNDRLLAFAAGEGLRLPTTEIRKIASVFDPQQAATFEPTMAQYDTYRRQAPSARHLFIASQGALTPGNRRQTYLEIQPSEAHDSRLSAAEIATIPIDAELVTLAACDTAAAEALLSDERLDLTRAFLIAGAASVLATRWKVPEDYRITRFLVDFYRLYREGGSDGRRMRKDRALTEARKLSRERGDPAQIWAAWVLVGDAR